MKPVKFLTVLLLFVTFQGIAQKSTFKSSDPQPKVKSMTEKHYLIDANQDAGKQLILSHYYKNSFDSFGNRIQDREYDSAGNLIKTYKYYNTGDHRNKLELTDHNGKLIRTIEYVYNEDGLLDYDQSYDGKGNPEKRFVYSYDDKGKIREDYSYDNDNEFQMKFTYTYNFKDEVDRNFRFDNKGNLLEIRNYAYDQNGNMISEKVTDKEGNPIKTTTFQYVYDKKGNWTEKTIHKSGKPIILIKRELVY
jgi:hypothetical protein